MVKGIKMEFTPQMVLLLGAFGLSVSTIRVIKSKIEGGAISKEDKENALEELEEKADRDELLARLHEFLKG